MPMEDAMQRFHAMDALRAGALLLGVFGHAAISFFPDPSWVADDVDSSPALLVAFFTSHIFRMSLFFTIAGFFAHMLLRKRGVGGFIRNRLKRIALPFLVFWPLLLAWLVAVAFWAAGYAHTGPFAGAQSPLPASGGQQGLAAALWQNMPLGHTWFLYVLIWFYAVALALVALARSIDTRGRVAAALDSLIQRLAVTHVLPLFLAAPLAAVFVFHAPWTSTGGIQTPDSGLLPEISPIVGYGTAFAFGWLLHRQTTLLTVWRRSWLLYWAAAVTLSVCCARVMSAAALDPSSLPSGAIARLAIAFAYPLAIWAWCFALIGTATRFLSGESGVARYLSDSSYWIYLVHLPIVVAFQVLVSPWPVGWQMKYPFILALSIPILLLSYQIFVRDTPLGTWLNGRRYRKSREALSEGRAPSEATAALMDDIR